MRGRGALEAALAALRAARDTDEASCTRAVRLALERAPAAAAARAARLARERGLAEAVPSLASGFDRFLARPVRDDPGCLAKTAIVEALAALGADEGDRLLRAARHVQMEPVFGGRVDTAVDLRGAAGLALVAIGHRAALDELAELLGDPEPPVRISAARGLAALGGPAGVPLLRLRLRIGDPEPRVVTECLLAWLRLEPRAGLAAAVAGLESPDPARAEAAAAALGESRLPAAFAPLSEWVGRTPGPELRRAGLLAIGRLGGEEPFGYLARLLEESRGATAQAALEALAQGFADRSLVERATAAVAEQGDPRLAAELERRLAARR